MCWWWCNTTSWQLVQFISFNSLRPSDAIWRHKSRTTLAQVMACCLTAPSHYLNQCWLITTKVYWYSSEDNFTTDTPAISCQNYSENYSFKISFKSPRGLLCESNNPLPEPTYHDWSTGELHRLHISIHEISLHCIIKSQLDLLVANKLIWKTPYQQETMHQQTTTIFSTHSWLALLPISHLVSQWLHCPTSCYSILMISLLQNKYSAPSLWLPHWGPCYCIFSIMVKL